MNIYKEVLGKQNFSFLFKKSILITGASGFLGMWLVRAINYLNERSNLRIKIIVLLRSKNKRKLFKIFKATKIEFIKGSITNFVFVNKKIDYVVHLAAETSEKKNKDYIAVTNTIINGTIRLIKYCEKLKISSITYLSSGGIYGKNCKSKKG